MSERYPYDVTCLACSTTYVAWLQPGHERGERFKYSHQRQPGCGIERHLVTAPLDGIAPSAEGDE